MCNLKMSANFSRTEQIVTDQGWGLLKLLDPLNHIHI